MYVAALFGLMVLYGLGNEGKSMVDRQGVIIYLHHLRQAKSFRKYGHVHYISRKMKYVVLYCDQEDVDGVISKVEQSSICKESIAFLPTICQNVL